MRRLRTIIGGLGVFAAATLIAGTPAAPASAATITVGAGPSHTIQNCDGRSERFRVAAGGGAEHQLQVTPGGDWTSWIPLGGALLYGDLDVGRNGDCKLEVYGIGTDHALWTTWQTQPGSDYHAWASIDGFLTSAPTSVVFTPPGVLGVCAVGGNGNTWCNRHTQPFGSPWTGWFPLS